MKIFLKIIFSLTLLLISIPTFAGEILVEKVLPATSDLKVGDQVLVNLSLRSSGTEYNAIEGALIIPPIFTIEKVVTGNSFVSVWVEDPARFTDGTIRFSGIAPAGYNREVGQVFSVALLADTSGDGNLELKDAGLFQNDGKGTREDVTARKVLLSVRETRVGEDPYLINVKDETPPEKFSIELVHDYKLYEGRYAIVWNAIDKGSGVQSYDVIEGRRVFKQVESPYVLEKQSLHGKIYVKAYDYEGNIQTAVFVPPGKLCLGDSCFGMKDVGFFVSILIMVYLIWRKIKSK